ncbi:endonuclease/exonuclease/phosphatase family protein [uncultured Gimesia sp.]|uniref:endonuclease/exonuclease/phosphatase family protein n=1 Tax=uncultured Gimesia sp. TaxID=1678688 RepID=UPI0030D8C963|tara:strand:- start:93918 stop:94952 length:1035 start_codon:yes stop_codon:yes gene_type:complete
MNSARLANTQSETAAQNAPVSTARLRFWLLKLLILILSAGWVLAVMIRFTVRDAGGLVPTLVFYVSPLILLSLGAATVFILSWYVRWHRIALVWFILTLLTGTWCWNYQFQRHVARSSMIEEKQPVVRVLFWNIGDRIWGMERVLDELRAVDADLIGLVEAGADSDKMKLFWKESFPGHPYQVVKEGLVLLSRIPISSQTSGALAKMGKYERFDVTFRQSPQCMLSVYLVDIRSDVLRSRKSALQELANQVSANNDHPILVLGDFNTPSDSVHFRPVRALLQNSNEVAGNGYMATWPLPLPVLDLDGIWANQFITVLSAENRWTWVSDHRPVVTQVLIDAPSID